MTGFGLGFLILSLVPGVVVGPLRLGRLLLLTIEEVLSGASDSHLHSICC